MNPHSAPHRPPASPERDSPPATTTTEDTDPPSPAAVYTVIEVARLLSLSRGSAYALVRAGEIPAKRMGGRWVIPKRRFHAWLDNAEDA
jgi:excisionase family DNA binding protein